MFAIPSSNNPYLEETDIDSSTAKYFLDHCKCSQKLQKYSSHNW